MRKSIQSYCRNGVVYMNILWICNVELPIISEAVGATAQPFGGWLDDLSRRIVEKHC